MYSTEAKRLAAQRARRAKWTDAERATANAKANARGLAYVAKMRENPEVGTSYRISRMLARAKIRARLLGVPFRLTRKDIVIPRRCPALGIVLRHNMSGKSSPLKCSPSLDRIIPSRGYVPGNVVVVSHKANTMKNAGNAQELIQVGTFYLSLKT